MDKVLTHSHQASQTSEPVTGSEAPVEVDRLQAELEQKEAEIAKLRERIRLLEKALFGPKSERMIGDPTAQLVFDELLAEVDKLNRDLEAGEADLKNKKKPTKVGAHTRRPRRNLDQLIPDDLREEEIIIDLPEEKKISLETGEPLVRIGETRTRKLAVKRAEYYVKVFVTPRYADPAAPNRGVATAPAPDFAIPGGTFDESVIADVIIKKTMLHLPLYRQQEVMRDQGIQVSRQTLSRLYIAGAEALLPIYRRMKADIVSRDVIFTDDTPVKMQMKGKGKTITGRMWVYVGGGAGPPYRIFEFTIDRSKARPKEFLKGFKGYIHADAYKGYDDLFTADVIECGCWMHVRRKYFESKDAPVALRQEVLHTIRSIYRYERFARTHPNARDDLLMAVRREKIAPLIERLFARTRQAVLDGEILPSSSFAGAITYMHNLGDALRTFLKDPRLFPDNGESERALRPLTIGRKNWLFVGNKGGGDATGILLSLVQSCRAMDIDPAIYIEDVLRRIQGHTANRVDELLPANWQKAESYYESKNA